MIKNINLLAKIIFTFILSLFHIACLIEEVEQPASIEIGSTFTSVLTIAAISPETNNPHHGVIAVLQPDGWEFTSGTFESTDPETPSGNIIMDPDSGRKWICTEAEYLADSSCTDLDTLISINEGMKWTFLMSDVGDFYSGDAYHEVTLNFNTSNGVSGTFPIGYIITVNTWEMLPFLNTGNDADDELNTINGTDSSMNHIIEVTGGSTAEIIKNSIPTTFSLMQNYPNPFNADTKIDYYLPMMSDILLSVHSLNGKLIENNFFKNHPSGLHTFNFNAGDLSTGVYIFTISMRNKKEHIKMLYLK